MGSILLQLTAMIQVDEQWRKAPDLGFLGGSTDKLKNWPASNIE